jgi:hypothetical protein
MFSNGGWAYDAYPELETLDAFTAITVADIKGPGVITCIHTIQHLILENNQGDPRPINGAQRKTLLARGIILEIYYNGYKIPSVRVPLGDFFADGCGGQAQPYGSLYLEKTPKSYNCFIPMPFEKSARVVLVNETEYDLADYTFVEYEQIPEWSGDFGYFHATWKRFPLQLTPETDVSFFHVDGCGHLLGRSWSLSTDESFFHEFYFIMEGNNEYYIDGEKKQRLDYLGSEDSFSFSWGFADVYTGPFAGMNFIRNDQISNTNLLSIFRFLANNVVRFNKSLDIRVNWSKEEHFKQKERFMKSIAEVNGNNGGWIDCAATHYWYQKEVGYNHEPMLPLADRCKTFLKSNKQEVKEL